jgi:DNA-binding NarL/FixJ family response regulator
VEYFVQSDRVREAFEEVKGLLAGKTSMACMGDMLTLAAFSHAIPINNSLLGAFTTEREALKACQDQQPDLLYITEQLEQGYGINLALKVKNISPATSVLLFLHRESQDVVREAIEANVDGIIFVHSIGQSADGDFLKSIRAIANGSSYYPKEVRTMAGYVKSIALAGLSDRESEVLEALC